LGLGFVALGNLPGNWVGAALILLAFGLAIAEVYVDGLGVLGMMAFVSFVAGGVLLFGHFGTPAPLFPDISVSLGVLLPAAVIAGGGSVALVMASQKGRRALKEQLPTTTLLVGVGGIAATALNPRGTVHVHGETWTALAEGEVRIRKGTTVEVVAEGGGVLTVRTASKG
jgi:membrane-bound serine protease (ClpP class)